MKIYVSPHYRTAMWGSTISLLIFQIEMIYVSLINMESFYYMLMNDLPWSMLLLISPVIILLFLFLLVWRLLIHTKIDEEGYQSCLGRIKLCYIDKNKDIYYTIIHDIAIKNRISIAFSNEPFEAKYHLTEWSMFDGAYDARKIILLPYNLETMKYFEIQNWEKIEMQYPEKIKKQ